MSASKTGLCVQALPAHSNPCSCEGPFLLPGTWWGPSAQWCSGGLAGAVRSLARGQDLPRRWTQGWGHCSGHSSVCRQGCGSNVRDVSKRSCPEVVVLYWEAENSCLYLCFASILGYRALRVPACPGSAGGLKKYLSPSVCELPCGVCQHGCAGLSCRASRAGCYYCNTCSYFPQSCWESEHPATVRGEPLQPCTYNISP